jgi:acyl-CoA synthetase (NDP forming)
VAGTQTLSESDSADLVARYGVPVAPSRRAASPEGAVAAADALGGRVVVKLHAPGLAHKSEHRLVRLGLEGADAVRAAAEELLDAAAGRGGADLLVARMVDGVLTEAIGDVAFRLVPLDPADAFDALAELRTQALLGPWRGEPAVDRAAVVDVLLALARLADDEPDVVSVDLNPLVVEAGLPVAVDALVEIRAPVGAAP